MADRKLAADIVKALRQVLSERNEPIALHEPVFSGREWDDVKECLDTGWVSSAGRFVERFERELAELTGIPHVVAVVNGTSVTACRWSKTPRNPSVPFTGECRCRLPNNWNKP